MALLEINLEKPALVEEIVDEDAQESTFGLSPSSGTSRRSGGGSALRKLGMFAAVVMLVGVARALKGRQSSGGGESEGMEVPIEDATSGTSGRGSQLRVLGMVLAVVGAVVAVRRMQNGNRR